MTVIIALIPCLLFGIYNAGHWEMVAETGNRDLVFWADQGAKIMAGLAIVLPLIVVSYGVGLTVEFIFGIIKGHSLHEGFLVSGMLIPLVMPADVPLWMVAVATVLAMKPEILVLDEPSSNLDPASRRELADILRSLDITMVMVTHDLPYAYELCARSVILKGGVIVADGSTHAILTDSALLAANRLELPVGFSIQ